MKVTHYNDLDGNWFKELISKTYAELNELRAEYQKKGCKTWMNPYDETQWVLTIQEKKDK